MNDYPEILQNQLDLIKRKQSFALVTIISSRRPSALKAGSKAIIKEDGTLQGWLGGSCTTREIVDAAIEAIKTRRTPIVRSFDTCQGGEVEALIEVFTPKRTLVIVGSQEDLVAPLTNIATTLGFQVEHIPIKEDVENTLEELGRVLQTNPPQQTCALVATMGNNDQVFVEKILQANPAYIGVIAGKKRAETIRKWLLSKGTPQSQVERVRSPAGLNIGAQTPAEIALSVAAEIVMTLNNTQNTPIDTRPTKNPAENKPEELVDPICGMLVEPTSKHRLVIDGKTIVFCSQQCMETYLSQNQNKTQQTRL